MFPFDIDPDKVRKAGRIAAGAKRRLVQGIGVLDAASKTERDFKRERRENGRRPHGNFKSAAKSIAVGTAAGAALGGYKAHKDYKTWYKEAKNCGAAKETLDDIKRRGRKAVRNGALIGAGIGAVSGAKIYNMKNAGNSD